MLNTFGPHRSRSFFISSLLITSVFALSAASAAAQTAASSNSGNEHSFLRETSETKKKASDTATAEKRPLTTEEKLDALTQMVEQQNERLNQLQQTISEQQETIRLLAGKTNGQPAAATMSAASTAINGAPETLQAPSVEDRLKKVETRVSEIGAIKFSGDIRLRSESIFGQQNILANGDNPAVLGNELTPRHRMRLRARLQMRGTISDE